MIVRQLILTVLCIAFTASAYAGNLPWQETKVPTETESAPAIPTAKFFPINPAALMRPPIRNSYGLERNKAARSVEKPKFTNGTTTISEEAAQKLLSIYAN
jgi:hypothetical protein